MKLVSVIIPIYNVEKYLRKCLDTIVNQTFVNIEIILVNDGSIDGSKNICEEYKIKDNRIKLINKNNGGLSDARNVGISNAKGDYLIFIDSDDFVELDMIEILYKSVVENNADIAVCGFDYYMNDLFYKKINQKNKIQIFNREQSILRMLDINDVFGWTAWNKIYKKDLFFNLKYPKGKLYEDMATTYKLILNSSKVIFLPEIKYHYRIRANSIMTKKSLDNKENDRREIAERMYNDLKVEFKENKKVLKEVDVFLITQYMEIINTMVLTDMYNIEIIKFVKKKILEKLKSIFVSNICIVKKIQYLTFFLSYKLYKCIYIRKESKKNEI